MKYYDSSKHCTYLNPSKSGSAKNLKDGLLKSEAKYLVLKNKYKGLLLLEYAKVTNISFFTDIYTECDKNHVACLVQE